jgi:hypothetical protein
MKPLYWNKRRWTFGHGTVLMDRSSNRHLDDKCGASVLASLPVVTHHSNAKAPAFSLRHIRASVIGQLL